MPTIIRRILIACFFAIPSLVFAADTLPASNPAAPVQTVEPAPAGSAQKPPTAVQAARIGYVDIVRIATESEQGKALKTLLTQRKEILQEKLDKKKTQIEKLKTSIEAKIATLSPQQREAKAKEFQKKVEAFQKLAQTSEEELITLQEKETKKLYDAIEQAAMDQGAADGFAAIVVKKEMLYVSSSADAQDVTDTLIKTLNQADLKK